MSRWESLKATLNQTVESVQRNARIDIVSGGVDEIDPPEDLDEFADQARTTGIVRANMRKWVNDVWEPGYRIDGPDETVEFFTEDMSVAPGVEAEEETGWLDQAAVFAGERHQSFYDFAKECTWQKWVRGTVLIELLKSDPTVEDWKPTGFYFIRPETVNVQVENNSDILLPPDPDSLPEDISRSDVDMTQRGEVASYIQFDDESIIGIRRGGYEDDDIPLSQNDVLKTTLEAGIGGDIADGDNRTLTEASSVFGNSVIKAVSEEIAEYNQIKRDRAEAISRKAYGVYTAQFTPEVIDLGGQKEVIEWTDESISDTESELRNMGPGDVLTSDANIDLEKHESEVPDLNATLEHYVDDILSALPVPKALTGFADNVNRDVVSDQREAYADLLSEERQSAGRFWTEALIEIAERYNLPTDGLELTVEPEREDNPVKTLDTDTIERMNTYISTLNAAAGPQAGPTALVSTEEILDVLDFPRDEDMAQDMVEEIAQQGDEATKKAWNDIMGLESLQRYSEGDVVDTPQGLGIISGVFTEGFDNVEASEDSPTYAVALEDPNIGNEFYKASDLSSGELPEGGPENPTDDVEAMANINNAVDGDVEALDFNPPESWRESDLPARTIALKAWAGMNGQFDCGGACCKGEMRPKLGDRGSDEFCASFKDYVLGTEQWRGWGA